jgi:hypothetical protein
MPGGDSGKCQLTRDAMFVSERFESAFGPGVQDPISCVRPSILSFVFSLVPQRLDLGDKRILVSFSSTLGLSALGLEVSGKLLLVPVLVWCNGVVIPVLLDQVLKIFAIGWGGIRYIVVG